MLPPKDEGVAKVVSQGHGCYTDNSNFFWETVYEGESVFH